LQLPSDGIIREALRIRVRNCLDEIEQELLGLSFLEKLEIDECSNRNSSAEVPRRVKLFKKKCAKYILIFASERAFGMWKQFEANRGRKSKSVEIIEFFPSTKNGMEWMHG
jgi:hypothetical protein